MRGASQKNVNLDVLGALLLAGGVVCGCIGAASTDPEQGNNAMFLGLWLFLFGGLCWWETPRA